MLKVLIPLTITSVCIYYFSSFSISHFALELLQKIENLGEYRFAAFFFVNFIAYSLCFPATILFEFAAGFLFGILPGYLVVTTSKTLSGILAWIVTRALFQDRIKSLILSSMNARMVYRAVEKEKNHFQLAMTLRLSPVPTWINNYVLSLSPISFLSFTLAAILGSTPMNIHNVYMGTALGTLACLIPENSFMDVCQNTKTGNSYVFLFVGVISSFLIMRLIYKFTSQRSELEAEILEEIESSNKKTQ